MNRYITTTIIASFFSLVFVSCTKSGSSTNNTSTQIAGSWTMQRVGTDYNGNGIADPTEWYSLATFGATGSIVINSSGTGIHTLPSYTTVDSTSFHWSETTGNTYLVVNYVSGISTSYHIDTLTSNLLVLRDSTGGTFVWRSYTK